MSFKRDHKFCLIVELFMAMLLMVCIPFSFWCTRCMAFCDGVFTARLVLIDFIIYV